MTKLGDRQLDQPMRQLRLYLYVLPVLGVFPALWQLFFGQGDRTERKVSRQAVMLMATWLLFYLGLGWGGTRLTGLGGFRLMFFNAMATSGYFASCLWLMVKVWQKADRAFIEGDRRAIQNIDAHFPD